MNSSILSMNFSNLTSEGYTAFIFAIIFSIICLAAFVYFTRHKDLSRMKIILITLVFPALAIFFWVYLILNLFEFEVLVALGISLGISVGYAIIALCIAFIATAIINSKKSNQPEKVAAKENAVVKTEKTDEEQKTKLLTLPETVDIEQETIVTEKPAQETIIEFVIEDSESETTEEQSVEDQPAEEQIEEPAPVETELEDGFETIEEETAEETEQEEVFSNIPRKTFKEQLFESADEIKSYFNEILDYAKAKTQTKYFDSKYHVMVKVGRLKLLEARFVREVLVCNFMAGSSELKNYKTQEKAVKIKEKPVVIEIDSSESVIVAKNMIDIVFKNIEEAIKEKLEEKKANRKKAKANKLKNSEIEDISETEENSENE